MNFRKKGLFARTTPPPEYKPTYSPESVRELLADRQYRVSFAKVIGKEARVKPELMALYDEVAAKLGSLDKLLEAENYSTIYADQLASALDRLTDGFSQSNDPNDKRPYTLQDEERDNFKRQQEGYEPSIRKCLTHLDKAVDFFSQLTFLNYDLVIIGSNGAGKTSLAEELKSHIKKNGIVVSAQRILKIPDIKRIKIASETKTELQEIQTADKRNRGTDINSIQGEFEILIQGLLSNDATTNKAYTERARRQQREGKSIDAPELSSLQKTLSIWNDVFRTPELLLEEGMNIMAINSSGLSYRGSEMSDGEKVVLFLIAQVLQCPAGGFVIVDEPEMYLHPTIHRMLWDRLEYEQPDSTYIYLTHDLEFAASRTGAKKVWLRSFTYPNTFRFQEIPSNIIPKPLLMELLGSRHNILFCEGVTGGLDSQLYTILFPDFIVKPVGGCQAVIDFTKAYNKIPDKAVRAIGLIDTDFHSTKRLQRLEADEVYSLTLAEIENVLLIEPMLRAVAADLGIEKIDTVVETIKGRVLDQLSRCAEQQVMHYVTARVNQHHASTHVHLADTAENLEANYRNYLANIRMTEWIEERQVELNRILSGRAYSDAIKIMNDKSLKTLVGTVLRIKNYQQHAIALLQKEQFLRDEILATFPLDKMLRS